MPPDAMTDWYDANAERYDTLEHGVAGDVAFYVARAAEAAPPVLELGCGTGRVAIAIARSGTPITGLDRSAAMLAVARRKSRDSGNPRWVEGDMRTFHLGEEFGLICIPHRGFQHLLTSADQRAALERCRAHLRPGGHLVFNVANPLDRLLTTTPARALFGRPYPTMRMRYTRAGEMTEMLNNSGFVIDALYGACDRRPFDEDSIEQVWVARRAERDDR